MAANVRSYCPGVRVGNWNEDLHLEEDTLKDFLERRDKGQLLIQRSSGLMGRMMDPVKLSTTSDGYVRYGDVVMVVNKGNPDRTVYGMGLYPRDDSCLAIHLDSSASSGSMSVHGSKKMQPCFRTAFTVAPADDHAKDGDVLSYGQPFSLRLTDDKCEYHYLYSDQLQFNRSAEKSRHQVVQMVKDKTFRTHWQIEHVKPMYRLEFEHSPVKANELCVIRHCKTFQNLCVEENHTYSTVFGTEYEITANTQLNCHKVELPVNNWLLTMGSAGDQHYPVNLDHVGNQAPIQVEASVQPYNP